MPLCMPVIVLTPLISSTRSPRRGYIKVRKTIDLNGSYENIYKDQGGTESPPEFANRGTRVRTCHRDRPPSATTVSGEDTAREKSIGASLFTRDFNGSREKVLEEKNK